MNAKQLLFIILLTGCHSTDKYITETGPEIRVVFCGAGGCSLAFEEHLSNEPKIDCAFFTLDDPDIARIVKEKEHRIVLDNRDQNIHHLNARFDTQKAYMHNKFCAGEKVIITGSWNPSEKKDRNNMIIVHSATLARWYRLEFEELWGGTFGGGKENSDKVLFYNDREVTVLFCPEDFCEEEVLELLEAANTSIRFMQFSMTSKRLEEMLLKKHKEHVSVIGIIEPWTSPASIHKSLAEKGLPVFSYAGKGILHHKVFIIDENIVITGSANPSKNGFLKNDENLIIIRDEKVAAAFLQEWNETMNNAKIFEET